MIVHCILYVKDQEKSKSFYSYVLGMDPTLDVPGMTEFRMSESCILGLMPEAGIKRLLGERLPDPATANGTPRAELYILVQNAEAHHQRALQRGAKELSGFEPRDWQHTAAYCLDLDGHVLAFAQETMPA